MTFKLTVPDSIGLAFRDMCLSADGKRIPGSVGFSQLVHLCCPMDIRRKHGLLAVDKAAYRTGILSPGRHTGVCCGFGNKGKPKYKTTTSRRKLNKVLEKK